MWCLEKSPPRHIKYGIYHSNRAQGAALKKVVFVKNKYERPRRKIYIRLEFKTMSLINCELG